MRKEFTTHRLNEAGIAKAREIGQAFDALLEKIERVCDAGTQKGPTGGNGRELALVRTKLEEACFFAKKAMAVQECNQEPTNIVIDQPEAAK